MLLVHPSSQCDVCLDPYTWTTAAKSPHAIQCGHVFCLDCLRSVHPTNCPLCRKGFNPERIKKLHVDKVNGDGSGPAGAKLEEYEFFRRIAVLFDHRSEPEEINALVEEVNAWVARSTRLSEVSGSEVTEHPLRTAVTALHQYRALYIEKEETRKQLSKLREVHQRQATLKDSDIHKAMLVERQMLQERGKAEEAYQALLNENARLQAELRRYTHSSNPLPRPPEINPRVTSMTRQLATLPSGQQGAATAPVLAPHQGFLPNGVVVPAEEPQLPPAAESSTTQVAPPAPEPGARPKYRTTSTGEELRQENRRRSHFIVPGAPFEARVVPEPFDMHETPRASAHVPFDPRATGMSMYAGPDWIENWSDPRPRPGDHIMSGGAKPPHAKFMSRDEAAPPPAPTHQPTAHPYASSPHGAQPSTSRHRRHAPAPAAEMVTAGVPYPTRSARIRTVAPDEPIVGHQPMEWRPGHEDHTGQVEVWDPKAGIRWLPEPDCRHLAVRARGTQSESRYAIAKEPSQLDDGDVSPGPNPLQLSGIPESVLAGPSGSAVHREVEEAPFSTAREGSASTLFQSQRIASARVVTFAPADPGPSSLEDTSLSALHGFAAEPSQGGALFGLGASQEPGQSATARPLVRNQVPAETLPQPSPASSWGGTYQPSRRSSLSLHVNNLPPPSDSQDSSDSADQVSGDEFFGQSMTVDILSDNASGSFRSGEAYEGRPSGLLLNTSREGSSRQVVTGLHDLQAINRSLSEIAEAAQSDTRSARPSPSASASSRQLRQAPASGNDSGAHVGLRTGIALYSSRPTTQYPATGPSTEPLPAPPAPSNHVRSLSRTSTRSHAESTVSHNTSGSGGASSQRPSGQRHRRSSTASSVHFHDQVEAPSTFWPAESQDTHTYTSQGPYADAPPRGSQDSIPRSLGSIGEFGAGGGLLLSFEAPSTSAAVDRHGDAAAGIHAPRPVASSRSSTRSLFSGAWNARNGR